MDSKPAKKLEEKQKRKTGAARPLTEDEATQVKGGTKAELKEGSLDPGISFKR
jgi:hypothetical protein